MEGERIAGIVAVGALPEYVSGSAGGDENQKQGKQELDPFIHAKWYLGSLAGPGYKRLACNEPRAEYPAGEIARIANDNPLTAVNIVWPLHRDENAGP